MIHGEKPDRNTLNWYLSVIIPTKEYKKAARLSDYLKSPDGRVDHPKRLGTCRRYLKPFYPDRRSNLDRFDPP
jgi:hypothetical protein